jgi:hypothetical protein
MKTMSVFNSHRLRSCLAGLACVSLTALTPVLGGNPKPEADEAGKKRELIRLQMINAMMYAADDFFGEARHLIYADQPLPPTAPPPVITVAPVRSRSTSSIETSPTVAATTSTPGVTDPPTGGGTGTGTGPGTGGDTGGGVVLPPDIGGGGGDPGGGGCPT